MRVRYERSIQERIDEYIDLAIKDNVVIEHIELNESEYIQFLEEITPTQRVLLSVPPKRIYRLIQLKVVP